MGKLQAQMTATAVGLGVHVLGPIRVTREGLEQRLGGARQRRLLAVLLINHDSVVSVDRVAEAVFAGEPSDAAATTLRSYVARLRRVIGDVVATRAPGYQLSLAGFSFDVTDFESGVGSARDALRRQDPVAAVESLRAALSLWHGEAYAEFADEPWAYPESQRLAELRLTAQELLGEAELACGHAAQVIPALEALCREHPLREAFRAQLMTAYYRTGRQADALGAFRSFHDQLVDELGVDPSPPLVELERRILDQDPELVGAVTGGEPLRGYRLGERLGTGREGTVYAAHLAGVDRELVVKVMRAEVADDPGFIRAFEAVATRVASLRHPAVVPIHDWWREPGAAYVVMRRLPGGTLRDRLSRSPLAAHEIVTLVERLGGVLGDVAALGLAHGRVTVDNVLYDASGEPVLSDFWLGGPEPPAPDDDVRGFAAVVGAALAGRDIPPKLAALLDSPGGVGVEKLTELVRAALGAGEPAAAQAVNPYQGLRAFDESDAENYFGRASLVDDVLARLSGDDLRSRLVLLVGPSGTGKSSAVRAGLLPRLRAGGATGSEAWFVATMLPGGAPYKELAESLRRVAVGETENLTERLRGVDGIDRVLRGVVPEEGQLVLVIDQFEELFTLTPEAEQRAFLEALTHALAVSDSRLRVVATLRADYYDRPLGVQPFGSLVQDATMTIPAMLPAEVEAAVVEPARRAGRVVERALGAELVASMASEPAALPALQLMLFELADRSPDGTLSLAAYQALGGLEGAIAARAEELYQSLEDGDRRQVKHLFERLVVVGGEGEPTRRRASRGELNVSREIVDRWVAARLLTLDVHPQTRAPTIEVAHEALVREWPRLRQWVEDDRSELIVLDRIRESAAAWADLDREASALLRGTALEAAADIAGRRTVLAPLEAEFVEASRAARDEERSQQVALIRRQARTNRRLRWQLAGIGVALVVALAGGLAAVNQRQEADFERHIAVARELSAAADANVRDDPERSILLALAAVDATGRYDEPVLPEALEALHRGVASARILRSFAGAGGTMDWSANGKLFVSEGIEDSGLVDIRDAVTGATVQKFRVDALDLNDAVFSADSRRVVTAGDEGAIRVWDIATGRKLSDLTLSSDGDARGPSMSPDGRLVAGTWAETGKVRVVPVAGGAPWVFRGDFPLDTSFSPDGRRLAVSDAGSETVHVLGVRTHRRLLDIRVPGIGESDVTWSPDGRWIATGGSDGGGVYDTRNGRLRLLTQGHTGLVNGVDWSPDGNRLATASNDGTARVFALDGRTSREVARFAAQDMRNGVRSVAFSPDGDELMTSDWRVTAVKVWDARDQAAPEIANISGVSWDGWATPMTPDGRSLWGLDDHGTVERYDMATGQPVQRLPRSPLEDDGDPAHLSLSPDGRLLAVVGFGLPFPVWDTVSGQLAFVVGQGQEGYVPEMGWDETGEHLAVSVTTIRRDVTRSRVQILDRGGAEVGRVLGEPHEPFLSLAFRGDGDTVAASVRVLANSDPSQWSIRIWDWREGRLLRSIKGSVNKIAFDSSGGLLVTTRFLEGVAEVWDAKTGERVSVLEGHTSIVSDVAFDPEGERVASAGSDGSVRVWDPRTGEEEAVLQLGTPVGATGVAFSPDGTRLVTTWEDGTTRIWTLDLHELIDIARRRVTRGLTPAECKQYLHVATCPSP